MQTEIKQEKQGVSQKTDNSSLSTDMLLRHQRIAMQCVDSLIDDVPFATSSDKDCISYAKLLKVMGGEKVFDAALVLGRLMQARLNRSATRQITHASFKKSALLLSRTGLYSTQEILSAIPVLTRVWTYSDELRDALCDELKINSHIKFKSKKDVKVPLFIQVVSKTGSHHHSM